MSDLHCRLSGSPTESILEVGATRIPPLNHPIQALLSLFSARQPHADALLLPGDLTNRACREGLNQGWDFAIEVARSLGTEKVIPVLGNHDVDSRRSRPDRDAFYDVRNLRPGFPFKDEDACRMYFSEGFCIEQIGEFTQVIAINTVIDHHNEQTAQQGGFDDGRVHRLSEFLKAAQVRPIRIAVMHHHPILHSGPFNKDLDVIQNGDKMIKVLRENGCRLVVHGHKHLARLSMSDGVAVFASGSFSANLGIFASSMANMFHFAEIEELNGHVRGRIETWVFHYGTGWGRANPAHSGFCFSTGFGAIEHVDRIAALLVDLAVSSPSLDRFPNEQVLAAVPDFAYLTPAEVSALEIPLRAEKLQLLDGNEGVAELWRLSGS
jgi:predicted phosphodiesterase